MDFFELTISSVPVVVLFTKFDALLPVALGKLRPADQRLPLQERLSKAKPLVESIFNGANVWDHLSRMIYPPKSCVQIEGVHFFFHTCWVVLLTNMLAMHKSNEGCNMLLESTAAVLDEEALQMLFVSAQETNIELCIKNAIKW